MNQLNNPLWPFPVHNGERTAASSALLNPKYSEGSFYFGIEAAVQSDPVTDTNLEKEALI